MNTNYNCKRAPKIDFDLSKTVLKHKKGKHVNLRGEM